MLSAATDDDPRYVNMYPCVCACEEVIKRAKLPELSDVIALLLLHAGFLSTGPCHAVPNLCRG